MTMDYNMSDGFGVVNQAGVDHYNKLIDALLAKGKLLPFDKWKSCFLNTNLSMYICVTPILISKSSCIIYIRQIVHEMLI